MTVMRFSEAVLEWLEAQDDPRAKALADEIRAKQCPCGVSRVTCPEHRLEGL